MPCPMTALHLPILFLLFLFPLSLSMTSSQGQHLLSPSRGHPFADLVRESSPQQTHLRKRYSVYGPSVAHRYDQMGLRGDYEPDQGPNGYGAHSDKKRKVLSRRATYNTYNSSNLNSSESKEGEGGKSGNADVVHKLLGSPAPADAKATPDAAGAVLSPLKVGGDWNVVFFPDHVDKLEEGDHVQVTLVTQLTQEEARYYQIRLISTEDDWVASVDPQVVQMVESSGTDVGNKGASQGANGSEVISYMDGNISSSTVDGEGLVSSWSANFSVKGLFVGFAKIRAVIQMKQGANVNEVQSAQYNVSSKSFLKVSVIRRNSWMDRAFTVSIAVLVSILFVNFGAALDWNVLRETLKRPIGPSIGFLTQFLFMPVVGYVLGLLLFDSPSMRLGLFFTGCSPGGGASNIWTFALGGNLPLSITMTTISTFASFGMMPFWLFTLGATIFTSAELSVPYNKIATFAIALVVPLALGFLMQKKCPKAAHFLVRHLLKPLCGFLLVFIVVFAIATNLYIFHLFSWKIILCGMGLPWLGFACGALAARLFSLSSPDILAIAIETGVQNTGIAIFMLRFTLGQPLADLTTVVPVSIAIMTPVPLALLWLYRLATGKIHLRMKCRDVDEVGVQRPLRDSTVETFNGAMTPIDRKV